MRRLCLATAVASLLALAAAGPIAAQGPAEPTGDASVEPVVPGKGSKLTSILRGRPAENQTPQGATLKLESGFKVDPRAIVPRCTTAQADANNCPADSSIGSGTAAVVIRTLLGDQQSTLAVNVYAADPMAGEILGVYVKISDSSTGQQSTERGAFKAAAGAFGVELVVDPLPRAENLPPGVTVLLKESRTRIEAKRTVTRTVVKKIRNKRTGRVRKVSRKVRTTYHLIRNPRTCDGSWAAQTSVRFDDRTDLRDFTINCARGR